MNALALIYPYSNRLSTNNELQWLLVPVLGLVSYE